MIRLEITDPATGHILVPHLPADISFEMARENPLFNRRGDYTYDIDISLRDPHNRAIYQHIDRLTATARPQNRRARLLCDGHVICDGTEVILKKEGDTLKVQILAGNSELNILTADENLRIREMNFGTIPTPTVAKAQEVANQIFPQTNYVFPIIYKNEEEGYDNEYLINGGTTFWPQPFLLYYVEKFIQLLGYTISYNALRSYPRWRRLVVISGYQTLEYAKMLPDWSAAEFLTYVEQFFNCVFVVNHLTKEVEIRELKEWYAVRSPLKISPEDITDEFLREYDTDGEEFQNNYRNVSYALPSGDYWKYTSLDEEVQRHCERMTKTPTEAAQLGDVNWKIFTDPDYGFEFIRIREEVNGGSNAYSRMVNQFAPYISEAGASNTELKIIPAEIHLETIYFARPEEDPMFPNYGYILCARPQFYEKEENTDFNTAILSGIKDNAGTVMQVAFYAGEIGVRVPSRGGTAHYALSKFTMCFAQRYYLEFGFMTLTDAEVPGFDTMTMELNGVHGRAAMDYTNARYADTTQKHTIYIREKGILNPTDLFLIHNRLFVCQQLKYSYRDGHQHPIVEGTFFPYI